MAVRLNSQIFGPFLNASSFTSRNATAIRRGAAGGLSDGSPVTLVPVGKGSIDWTKTFTAARIGGVEHIFVDQRMEFMRESVAFLKALKA
jgi:hypothetical protein